MLDVDAVTQLLKAAVGPAADPAVQYLVGVGEAPAGGGWEGGTAGQGKYVPYLTLTFAGAAPIFKARLGTYDRDWQASFTVKTYGSTYDQLSRMGQVWRSRLEAYVAGATPIGSTGWKVIGLDWQALGPVRPDKSTTPYTWEAQDSVALICSNT